MNCDPRFAVSQEMEAKQTLLDQLRALATEDPDFFTDLVEAKTNLLELIAALDASIVEDEILVDGTKATLDKLQNRKRAAETRIELKRRLLAHTLKQIGLKTLRIPTETLTLAEASPLPAPPCQSSTSERPSRTGTLLRCCHNAAHSRSSRTFCLRDLYSCDGNLSGCWHRWASPHPLDTQRCSNVCIFQGGSNWRSGRNLRRQGTDKTIARTRGVNWLNRPPRNSNDAIAIQSYCASPAKRDTNSLAISYLEGAVQLR